MPYLDLGGALDTHLEQSKNAWQVRVAIDPRALDLKNPDNKIEIIKKILKEVFQDEQVSCKLYQFSDGMESTDFKEGYDGASGKDRDQLGKEICIYCPDTDYAKSADFYKEKLLTLWVSLQREGIPLMHRRTPGDQAISSTTPVATPFSVTRNLPWDGRHGILFNEFSVERSDQHPILDVKITELDLKARGIRYDPSQIALQYFEQVEQHQNAWMQSLQSDIQSILSDEAGGFASLLVRHDWAQNINSRIERYNAAFEAAQDTKTKGEVQARFEREFKEDALLQAFLNGYPREADSNFLNHPYIQQLRGWKRLSPGYTQELVSALTKGYREKIDAIKVDFRSHIVAADQSSRTMRIDWNRYIPGYSDERLEELVLKNPYKMQMLYRRVILLERERRGYEAFALKMMRPIHDQAQEMMQTIHNEAMRTKLQNFFAAIQKIHNSVAPSIFNCFMALHIKLADEIATHKKCSFDTTPYPTIISHFTTLAQGISSGQPVIENFYQTLNQDLQSKRPVSKKLKVIMYGVLGAIIGGVIGLVIGAAVTFWGSGAGSLPGGIAGGIAGWSTGTALAMGGAAVGGGLIAGTSASVGVFWNAKKKQANYNQEKERVCPSMIAVCKSLKTPS